MGDEWLNDYPHFGIWPDGYYMTLHQFDATSQAYQGAGIAVYERDAMLSGLTAQQIRFDTGTQTLNYGGHLPADLEGFTAPTAGAPNHVFEWDNAGWIGDPVDTIRIWNVHVDWTTPANSTFGANAQFDPDFTLQPADATVLSDTGEPCFNTRNCIPQPATAQKLDAISDGRLMYRASDRFLSDHESVLIQEHRGRGQRHRRPALDRDPRPRLGIPRDLPAGHLLARFHPPLDGQRCDGQGG